MRITQENLERLESSALLKPDQKLIILNQYLFPMLVYLLQTAPLTKLRPSFPEGIDVIIRWSTKAIIGLPANTSSTMLYAPRRYRGLALMRCEWEAPLQHHAIAQKPARVPDAQFRQIFDEEAESAECLGRFDVDVVEFRDGFASAKTIRQSLKQSSFESWKKCR